MIRQAAQLIINRALAGCRRNVRNAKVCLRFVFCIRASVLLVMSISLLWGTSCYSALTESDVPGSEEHTQTEQFLENGDSADGNTQQNLATHSDTADEVCVSSHPGTEPRLEDSPDSDSATNPLSEQSKVQASEPIVSPTATVAPEPTADHVITPTPKLTATPAATKAPEPTAAPAPTPTPKPTATPSPADPTTQYWIDEVFRLTNLERTSRGLPALNNPGSRLLDAAAIRAEEISVKFSHQRPCGSSCFTVLDELNISYTAAAENILMHTAGYYSPDDALSAWMNSPGHRDNILSEKYTTMGVGFYNCGKNHHLVQLFIRK